MDRPRLRLVWSSALYALSLPLVACQAERDVSHPDALCSVSAAAGVSVTHECQPRTVYVREQTEKGRRWKPIGKACPECFTSSDLEHSAPTVAPIESRGVDARQPAGEPVRGLRGGRQSHPDEVRTFFKSR